MSTHYDVIIIGSGAGGGTLFQPSPLPASAFSYGDLEPYYTEAERLYQVHGERGVDPTEPPASGPYRHPPVNHEPRVQQLSDDFARLGVHPFHVPLGIMLDETNPHRSQCIRCETCDGHPCLVQAKADAQAMCVDPALAYPNVTLLTGAYVARLDTSTSGREVTGVVVERQGVRESYSADIVVVSAGAINSAALLLRSANERHPRGLANSSDVVGRHYMGHVNSVLIAVRGSTCTVETTPASLGALTTVPLRDADDHALVVIPRSRPRRVPVRRRRRRGSARGPLPRAPIRR